MSLYNALCGYTPGHDLLLSAIGLSSDVIPRYRDCFLNEHLKIVIYTRIGGQNRAEYAEIIEVIRQHPNYISDHDDAFDSTFAYFVFDPPAVELQMLQEFYNRTTQVVGTPRQRFERILEKMRDKNADPNDPELQNAMALGQRILQGIDLASAGGNMSQISVYLDGSVRHFRPLRPEQ